MSKAVLVMDMPKDCCDCKFCRELDEGVKACCEIMDNPSNSELCRIIDVHYCMEKPDWCPLRELPEKKDSMNLNSIMEKCKDRDSIMDSVLKQFIVDGYNACIDELLKGEEG